MYLRQFNKEKESKKLNKSNNGKLTYIIGLFSFSAFAIIVAFVFSNSFAFKSKENFELINAEVLIESHGIVSIGSATSFAVNNQGKVYAWGNNYNGQLGNGTSGSETEASTPIEILNLSNKNIIQIEAAGSNVVALTKDGEVYTWGSNSYGNNANGLTSGIQSDPYKITELVGKKIISIKNGGNFTLALDDDGNVYGWGQNTYGQIGDDTTTNSAVPVISSILSGKNIKMIETGSYHSMAVDNDGKLYTWGQNQYAQLGNGNTTSQRTPYEVTALNNVEIKSISAGVYHNMILTKDGKVYIWGYNNCGQIGIGTKVTQKAPYQITTIPEKIKYISAVGSSSFVIDDEDNVYGWGQNTYGQLAKQSVDSQLTPMNIENFSNKKIKIIDSNNYATLAIDIDNNVYTVGYNGPYSLLGDGSKKTYVSLNEVKGEIEGKKITQIQTYSMHNIALDENGKVYTWGKNTNGQCGQGSKDASYIFEPKQVMALDNKKVIKVDAGTDYSIVLTEDGLVYTWGSNYWGQIGNGTKTDYITNYPASPYLVTTLSNKNIIDVVAGDEHNIALSADGKVYTWGSNSMGQIGNDEAEYGKYRGSPYEVKGLIEGKKIVKIDTSFRHNIVLDENGKVYTWGRNLNSECGTGSYGNYQALPYELSGAVAGKTISKIYAGLIRSYVVDSTGKVYHFGYYGYGIRGDGTLSTADSAVYRTPTDVSSIFGNVKYFDPSTYVNYVVRNDNKLYLWGWGYGNGQLLDNSSDKTLYQTTPILNNNVIDGAKLVQAAGGAYHTAFLDNDGKVYTVGTNEWLQVKWGINKFQIN